MNVDVTRSEDEGRQALAIEPELRRLFHLLNNQLGIVLAHAELLESTAVDDVNRARAGQVVTSVLHALGTARDVRHRVETRQAGF